MTYKFRLTMMDGRVEFVEFPATTFVTTPLSEVRAWYPKALRVELEMADTGFWKLV
jgi:hypothetical protein